MLPVTRRLAYYEALDTAHVEGDMGPFIELVGECVREGFAPYWHVLGLTRPLNGAEEEDLAVESVQHLLAKKARPKFALR